MINQEELAICRKRGHVMHVSNDWDQCKACGMWVRKREVIDEQEDDPPEAERSERWQLRQMAEKIERRKRKESQ